MVADGEPIDMNAEVTFEGDADAETDTETITIPSEIDSTGSKLVYLYLRTIGEATVEEIQNALNMKQLALFPVLETLRSQDLVERDGQQYVCIA